MKITPDFDNCYARAKKIYEQLEAMQNPSMRFCVIDLLNQMASFEMDALDEIERQIDRDLDIDGDEWKHGGQPT